MKSGRAISKKIVIRVITVSLMIPLTPLAAVDINTIPIDAGKADISTVYRLNHHGNRLTLATDVWEKMKNNVPADANDNPINADAQKPVIEKRDGDFNRFFAGVFGSLSGSGVVPLNLTNGKESGPAARPQAAISSNGIVFHPCGRLNDTTPFGSEFSRVISPMRVCPTKLDAEPFNLDLYTIANAQGNSGTAVIITPNTGINSFNIRTDQSLHT